MSRLPPPPATTTPPSATPISTPPPTPEPRRSRLRHGASLLRLAVSLAAVGGVVWWGAHQEPPRLPDTRGELLAALAAVVLYGIATLIRGERWQRLLVADGARPR